MIYTLRGDGRCSTRKIRFRDEPTATLALAMARAKRAITAARRGTEDRIYRCPSCAGWHLTSKPRLQETA